MERLTNGLCREDVLETLENPLYKSQSETWLRLCEIEDILGDEYDLDRLRELVEADNEERCAVFPFKPGEKVCFIPDEAASLLLNKSLMDGRIHHISAFANGEIRISVEWNTAYGDVWKNIIFTVPPQNVMRTRDEAEAMLKENGILPTSKHV